MSYHIFNTCGKNKALICHTHVTKVTASDDTITGYPATEHLSIRSLSSFGTRIAVVLSEEIGELRYLFTTACLYKTMG
jgi:hypothetical protein